MAQRASASPPPPFNGCADGADYCAGGDRSGARNGRATGHRSETNSRGGLIVADIVNNRGKQEADIVSAIAPHRGDPWAIARFVADLVEQSFAEGFKLATQRAEAEAEAEPELEADA